MIPPRVFIIILQYNHSPDTIRCLNSIKQLAYPNYQVVVVDNASQSSEIDNTKKYLKSQFSQGRTLDLQKGSTLIFNEKNLGYAGGNNIGISYALEHGADYVFVLNNDTTVPPDLLDKLVATAESDPQVGIVGPAIREGDGRTAYYGKISWLKSELKHIYQQRSRLLTLESNSGRGPAQNFAKQNFNSGGTDGTGSPGLDERVGSRRSFELFNKEYVIGAGMLIKKEVLEKIEGFDEVYFLYFEDADLCLRAQMAGYRLKIAPETAISHQVSTSTSSLGKPLILRYHMRNALIFNSLNAPWPIRFSLIFWSAYILLKNFLKVFLFPTKVPAGEAIIDGVLDFYKNRYGKISH